ncbi:rRNA maturation RNase YbeY [Cellulophaga sp. HaHaR_3_176]|uniref:rRNA maturation RNase YbeY n=1 Tax=Cellulophaga sp. HaHaR_3_176 TaxID=1942464 RepID=UPI001C1FD88C|nr:rRNA maturation RNase YbeY [Cellulophaga sp. HaHaR_3_176]QWX83638.1 rRNA maturation RNase YbeY [Cellulophaga sp. HaHaR_3_176]
MIDFNYELDFSLNKETYYSDWLSRVIVSEDKILGNLSYVFCSDDYLLNINQEYLNHDTFTDIITFDYCEGNEISGDIFISIDRVKENAAEYNVDFNEELHRVMSHGVLHLIGYKDKSDEDASLMRSKEEEKIKLFHVEH